MLMTKPTIAVIGMGKVGITLTRALFKAGYTVVGVYNRTVDKARRLATQLDVPFAETLADTLQADLILIAVTDDAIDEVAAQLNSYDLQDKALVHTSGAKDSRCLQAVQAAMLGSLHPALPFAGTAQETPPASYAIEADHPLLQVWLEQIVRDLGGEAIIIPNGEKARYHAALVILSNYTVTLYAIAQSLLDEIEIPAEKSRTILLTLLKATVANLAEQGIPDALTGPLSRADITTLTAHLTHLDDPTTLRVYRDLARLSYPMLAQRGVNPAIIEAVLAQPLIDQ